MPKGVYERKEGEELIEGSGQDRIAVLEALLAKQGEQIETLTESAAKAKIPKPKRVIEHSCDIIFIEDKAVVGWEDAREINGELMWPITLRDADGKEGKDIVPLLSTLNGKKTWKAEILSQQAIEESVHQGPFPVEFQTVNPDEVGNKGFERRKIVLEQTYVTYKAKIRFITGPWTGKEIEVDTKCFNP